MTNEDFKTIEPTLEDMLALRVWMEMSEVPVYVTIPNPEHMPLAPYEVVD